VSVAGSEAAAEDRSWQRGVCRRRDASERKVMLEIKIKIDGAARSSILAARLPDLRQGSEGGVVILAGRKVMLNTFEGKI
jgi:hypothetical protein